jgi:hypothetical protein
MKGQIAFVIGIAILTIVAVKKTSIRTKVLRRNISPKGQRNRRPAA